MDRNFLTTQNRREKVLRELGSDVKDKNCIRELQNKNIKSLQQT